MQADNRTENHAGHGTHGKAANGFRKIGRGMGTAEDFAAGIRNKKAYAKGG